MTVSILVPYRPNNVSRKMSWDFLKGMWQSCYPDWQIVEADCPGEEWVKADALTEALKYAHGNIIVMADSDVWCDGIGKAVEKVSSGEARWAVPHLAVHRLTPLATLTALRGEPIELDLEEPPYEGVAGGGMWAMHRDHYEAAPLDRRFHGWGQEDQSADLAWTTLYGLPWRGLDPLWHFWHPPMPRRDRAVGSAESRALWERYRSANHNRRAMRELVGEGVNNESPDCKSDSVR